MVIQAPETNVQKAVDQVTALHYLNSPAHAYASLQLLKGRIDGLMRDFNDDPLLAAYQLRDADKEIRHRWADIRRWYQAVIEAYPDDIPPHGARLCQ